MREEHRVLGDETKTQCDCVGAVRCGKWRRGVTRHGHRVSALRMIPESSKNSCSLWRTGNNSLRLVAFIMVATISEAGL
jgi:hypothetical protein